MMEGESVLIRLVILQFTEALTLPDEVIGVNARVSMAIGSGVESQIDEGIP